jgi:hypothetical protein
VKTEEAVRPEDLDWLCDQCGRPLEVIETPVTYLGHRFATGLPQCPQCGIVMVADHLARGRMAEVERVLEDK